MSTKISMALCEQGGHPETEFTARCTLEFDDDSPIPLDPQAYQHTIHAAIAVCCRAVHEELRRHRRRREGATCSAPMFRC